MPGELPDADLTQCRWRRHYATSSMDGSDDASDLLRGFYVPALLRTETYDRVAGYFRSSGLAAASRGFTALLERPNAKIRLIAGCDLAPHDVQAILDGSTDRLEEHLGDELDRLDQDPERIRRGVKLFAHLMAKNVLEVKVAFRRHRQTGEPITLDDNSDGYVHEKWGLLRDAYDRVLEYSGSMNESATALKSNAENITVVLSWESEKDAEAIQEKAKSFEALWRNEHPNFLVTTIPDAIRDRLLRIGASVTVPVEIDGKPAVQEVAVAPTAKEWLRFAVICHAPRMIGGEMTGIYTAPITPWPHQELIARRLVETYPYGYLLCDEVGLGKTIETGLAFRALWLSGVARRILICPPASLISQWQREMADKFLMPFGIGRSRGKRARVSYVLPDESEEDRPNLFDRDLLIVSTGLAQRKERCDQLEASQQFDVTLVDEAHFARRQNSRVGIEEEPRFGKLYRALNDAIEPSAEALWLATATPMQLDAVEAYDLADLIGRLGSFSSEHSLMHLFYTLIGNLMLGRSPTRDEQQTLLTVVKRTQYEDPDLWTRAKDWLIDRDPQLSVAFDLWLTAGIWPPNRQDERLLTRLLFAISPLQRVMLRHTRPLLEQYRQHGLLAANLATRTVLPIPTDLRFRDDEKVAYDSLSSYCADLQREIGQNLPPDQSASLGFFLSLLQQRFSSSATAIFRTLVRRLQRVSQSIEALDHQGVRTTDQLDADVDASSGDFESDEQEVEQLIRATLRGRAKSDLEWEQTRLTEILPTYEALAGRRPTKTQILLTVIGKRRIQSEPGRYRQTVVFTRYGDTLDHLVDTLQGAAPDIRLGTFSGDGGAFWDVEERAWHRLDKNRDRIKQLFLRGEIDVLLCTDAAAEGLNLQTADLLVNYDLPWNPMKVEQRIGRIDRIGQKYDRIEVLNLATVGSVEQVIYGRLWERLRSAAGVVGAQQFSILPLEENDFLDLVRGDITYEQLEARADERRERHNAQVGHIEIPAEDQYHIFNKELRAIDKERHLVSLPEIERALRDSPYLAATGVSTEEADGRTWFQVKRPAAWGGLIGRAQLTADRELYEQGLEDEATRLRFASYGDAVFDELVEDVTKESFQPSCVAVVREASETEGDTDEKVGILACVRTESGQPDVVEVHHLDEVDRLRLDETATVPDSETEKLTARLRTELRRQASQRRDRQAILERHHQMGLANKAFMYLFACGWLDAAKGRQGVNDPEGVTQVIRAAEDMVDEGRPIIVDVPVDGLTTQQQQDLLMTPGGGAQPQQWRSLPHYQRAVLHVIKRERAAAKQNLKGPLTTTRLIEQIKRRAEALVSSNA